MIRRLPFALVIAIALSGCVKRHVIEQATRFVATAHVGVNAARDSFIAWDAQHQLDLVEQATSEADGRLLLDTYRAKRQRVLQAFQAAYTSISAVSAILPLIDAGTKPQRDLLELVDLATIAATELHAALAAINEGSSP